MLSHNQTCFACSKQAERYIYTHQWPYPVDSSAWRFTVFAHHLCLVNLVSNVWLRHYTIEKWLKLLKMIRNSCWFIVSRSVISIIYLCCQNLWHSTWCTHTQQYNELCLSIFQRLYYSRTSILSFICHVRRIPNKFLVHVHVPLPSSREARNKVSFISTIPQL